jgi:hypothetical protein
VFMTEWSPTPAAATRMANNRSSLIQSIEKMRIVGTQISHPRSFTPASDGSGRGNRAVANVGYAIVEYPKSDVAKAMLPFRPGRPLRRPIGTTLLNLHDTVISYVGRKQGFS